MIQLRCKKTRRPVFATMEMGLEYGKIDPENNGPIILSSAGSTHAFDFEIDCGGVGGEGTETRTDRRGDRLFVTRNYEEVPERDLEPYCDNMSLRLFTRTEVTLHFYHDPSRGGASGVEGIISDIEDRLQGSGLLFRPGDTTTEPVNATEMAMAISAVAASHEGWGLDHEGRDTDPIAAKRKQGMSIDPERSHWDPIPGHPIDDWKAEVGAGDTREGYEDWARNRIENAKSDGHIFCLACGNTHHPEGECDSEFCTGLRREHEEALEDQQAGHPVEEWHRERLNGDTSLGYLDWCKARIDAWDDEGKVHTDD